MKKRKVVTLGAGTGQATLLKALRRYLGVLEVTAVVSVTDNGGHSGVLRKQLGIPAVGDARQCLTALALNNPLRDQYESRNDLGHSYGNNRLAELWQVEGSLSKAILRASLELEVVSRVIPVTNISTNIACELIDGHRLCGEWEIIERQPRIPIRRMFLNPPAFALREASLAIQQADWVIIAPGSLRTGIISCLLAQGIREALCVSHARIIFVVNLMTHPGQTDSFTAQDHVDEFRRYAGLFPHVVVFNTGLAPEDILRRERERGSVPVVDGSLPPDCLVMRADLIPPSVVIGVDSERIGNFKKMPHTLIHDGNKLAQAIITIINGHFV